jgi:hypothetical protein
MTAIHFAAWGCHGSRPAGHHSPRHADLSRHQRGKVTAGDVGIFRGDLHARREDSSFGQRQNERRGNLRFQAVAG